MDQNVDRLVATLGGTSAVARLMKSKPSTVHSWRKKGITASRLDHLRLATKELRPDVDFEALASAIVPIDQLTARAEAA